MIVHIDFTKVSNDSVDCKEAHKIIFFFVEKGSEDSFKEMYSYYLEMRICNEHNEIYEFW